MKLAELGTAAKAPKPDTIQKIQRELEGLVGALNDWTSMVEDHLQDHVQDLEELVVANLEEIRSLSEAAKEQQKQHTEEIDQRKKEAEEQQRAADKALAEAKELLAKEEAAHSATRQDLSETRDKAAQDVRDRDAKVR